MGTIWSQMFPPAPVLTAKNLSSQKGKVFIVTGGYSGVGLELSRILFYAGAKVYIAGRSEGTAKKVIEDIKSATTITTSAGELEFLYVDLGDLTTIKAAADAFKAEETRLDVLWNNAGISLAKGTTKQGFEATMGTNCVGPFLFTQLLLPILESTARNSMPGATRVIWTSSAVVEMAPKGGVKLKDLLTPPTDPQTNYTLSKVCNWFLASELGRRVNEKGILSLTLNPGNLKTALLREHSWLAFFVSPLLYQPIFGAYTELWAGLSMDLGMEDSGGYIVPWGRKHPSPRGDLLGALRSVEEGGSGIAGKFWEWCENVTADWRS
jgi:NAD(P)-dependent dehydrogenase (short-subunit alcohol dehydrogenase family)